LCLICLLSTSAGASVVYSYVTDASSYSGSPGSIVPVSIYLQETLTGGSTSTIAAHNGLIGAGAAINIGSPVSSSAAQIVSGSFVVPAAFGGGNLADYNQGSGAAANNLEVSDAIGTSQPHVLPANGLVLLGTVNVTVGSAMTTFDLTSLDKDTINGSNSQLGQGNGNTVSQDGTDYDVTQSGVYTGANDTPAYTFTVGATSTVPEPASLSVFGIGALGLLFRRRRTA
jgi:hypothetical protein